MLECNLRSALEDATRGGGGRRPVSKKSRKSSKRSVSGADVEFVGHTKAKREAAQEESSNCKILLISLIDIRTSSPYSITS